MSSGFFSSHFSFAHSFIGCAGSYVYVCIYQMYTGRSEHKHIRNRDENTLWAIICNEEYESCDVPRDARKNCSLGGKSTKKSPLNI